MPVYTVHAPVAANARPIGSTDQFVLVRDGFHFWAFIASFLWLLYHRLWLVTLGYLVVMTAVTIGLSLLGVGSGTRTVVMLLIALWMGFEAASLRRWTLSRGRWRQLDVVIADDADTAERRFFDRWTHNHPQRSLPVDRGAPPPPRTPSQPPAPSNDVLGLFPWPGATR
jgi:hypothetical protein